MRREVTPPPNPLLRKKGEQKPCPHYPACVGCALIGTPYGEQLRIKRERVIEAFRRFTSLATLEVPEVIGSPRAFGYRNQAKLVVRRARGGLLLGMYRPGSHHVEDIRQCPVHHPLITRVLEAVAQLIERYDIPTYDERSRAGSLRYVVVRVSTWAKRAQVILVTAQRGLPHARELSRALRRVAGVSSVVQNINPTTGNVILGEQYIPLLAETVLIERIGSLRLKTSAGAFVQVNIPVARKLYQKALEWLAPTGDEFAADLYCGVGAMTFHLASAVRHVFGVEESAVALIDAKANVRLNGFHNVRFIGADAAIGLDAVTQKVPRIDALTVNPPRKGLDDAALNSILRCAPQRIGYISCDPSTLARDLDWFASHGWTPLRVQPYDMMPQTEHVECIAELRRVPIPPVN